MRSDKHVALPTTINDLLKARDDALRLIIDSRRLIDMAQETLAPFGSMLFPYNAQYSGDINGVRDELDRRMWRRAMDLTGFKQFMDAEAVSQFEKGLEKTPPEFTESNIRATFIDLRLRAKQLFQRGIVNVFCSLSAKYRTNAAEPFRVGPKMIMKAMVRTYSSTGVTFRYGESGDKINDIDRIFKVLEEKPFVPRALESAMTYALESGQVFEDEYFRAKGFKNGNMHFEFKRLDLLEKVNEQIAEFYEGGALADARAA